MVSLIPSRLKPTHSTTNSTSNSRSSSPMRSKGDSASPEGRRDNGLVLNIIIIKVGNANAAAGPRRATGQS